MIMLLLLIEGTSVFEIFVTAGQLYNLFGPLRSLVCGMFPPWDTLPCVLPYLLILLDAINNKFHESMMIARIT